MAIVIEDYLIPINKGHAVSPGWTTATDKKPMGVTWHWTAMERLEDAREVLGGENTHSSRVSAHYCIGRSLTEGIDRYVALEDRSWHAGIAQRMRWDGKRSTNKTKGARACIGVEVCNVGYERPGHKAKADWIQYANTDCKWRMKIQPWTDDQVELMIHVGKEIIDRWPHIKWYHHHGHHDICPGYKQDVAGFPFARVLRGIYDDHDIPDVWSPFWSPEARQRVLISLGYDLGKWQDDGDWGHFSHRALAQFQSDHGSEIVPHWTTFTCLTAFNECEKRKLDIRKIAETSIK